ncbi:MAG: hypothetical protein ACYCST_08570 [Acidimicrobiales bacterium]
MEVWRVKVDLVDEEPDGSGQTGRMGAVEGDGGTAGTVGDSAGQVQTETEDA